MSEKIAVIYSDKYLLHETGSHPESPIRVKKAFKLIQESQIAMEDKIIILPPLKASQEDVLKIHSGELLETIRRLSMAGGGLITLDTVISPQSYEVALLAAGGVIKAVQLLLKDDFKKAFALIRPPGHHASFNRAKGFCLLNNIAIAAKNALENGLRRILIFDWDAHHGDGTQEIFYDSPNVLYISIHQDGRTLYPGTGFINEIGRGEGRGFNVNIPLPPQATGRVALQAIRELVKPIIEQFKPELIMVSAGYDGHYADTISDLMFTTDTYYEMARILSSEADKYANGRIIVALEGGYHLKYTPLSILNTIHGLIKEKIAYKDKKMGRQPAIERYVEATIIKIKKILSEYWSF